MNILQLDMNLLKVLYVMLQTGTTGETAQRLNITPSAVSHALSRLREALGDPLFRREGNRQHPTPFAQALRDKLVPLFVSLNEEMFGEPQPHERRFRVVVPPALNMLLAPVLAQKAHQAQASVECVAFERRAWRDELVDGSIDLLLAVGDHQKQLSALHYERVGQTRLVILYGPPLRPCACRAKEPDARGAVRLSARLLPPMATARKRAGSPAGAQWPDAAAGVYRHRLRPASRRAARSAATGGGALAMVCHAQR